ncbi:biotin synthase auxiliary protein BsaP [Arthrobacter sp. PGP41]|uniref:biotin synthase auxiliary protein BsaP n=1 Tax=Arthrobacter sp. PGP41 TaxID=2079227 RepID=UPI0018F89F0A|nr:hypothetical protein [Arthrobacter sp. PGP41]
MSTPHNPAAIFCALCGEPRSKEASDGGNAPPSDARRGIALHPACAARLQLEPPRYCPDCGRRLKVQVSPLAWRATCSRHGTATPSQGANSSKLWNIST